MQETSFGICLIALSTAATLGGCNGNNSTGEQPPAAGGGMNVYGGASSSGVTGAGGTATSSRSGNVGGKSPTTALNSGGNTSGGNTSGSSTSGSSTSGGSTSSGSATASSATASGTSGGSTFGGNTADGATNQGGVSSTNGGTSSRGGAGGTTSGNLGGATTGGSVATGGMWRGPTPASATAKFPFPQNRFGGNCVYPKEFKNEDVQSVYETWKTDLVTSDGAGGFRRVKRPSEPGLEVNSTVSEGIAYGMIIAVYMADQELFDDLWQYSLLHSWYHVPWGGGDGTPTVLMNWYISSSGDLGKDPDGSGTATDADEDMAWALIMASKQWGGKGKLDKSYLDYAKQLLGDIWQYEIHDSKLPKNGSSWGDWNSLNISYFAPAYYRVFAKVSENATWGGDVVDCVYDTIDGNLTSDNGNQTNGLVPAFSNSTGGDADVGAGQSALRHDYQYDSCRTPFRIGLDACLFDETRAKAYVAKTSQFFAEIGAANIKDGYTLSGKATPEYASRGFQGRSAAFIGPAGVGAMHSSSYQSFVNDVWGLIRQNNMWCGGQYYDESWTMLTMLMMSGNFLDYTAETPK